MVEQRTADPKRHNCANCGLVTYETVGKQIDGKWFCFNCATGNWPRKRSVPDETLDRSKPELPSLERQFCPTCKGNGVVPIYGEHNGKRMRTGHGICPTCDGHCYAKEQPSSDQQHTHPDEIHRAGCPLCNPDKTVPELSAVVARMREQSLEQMARRFHEAYERLAPSFGYETRQDTRAFDPQSPNGRLMIAVCSEVCGGNVAESSNSLLQRLREFETYHDNRKPLSPTGLCREAADEIERLQRERDEWRRVAHAARDFMQPSETNDGYKDAFYEIAKILDMAAMPISPKEAFETVMVPKLRALVSRETPAVMSECPYCKRPADRQGGILHEAGCAGLETVEINRLQFDALLSRTAQKSTAPLTYYCVPCMREVPSEHKQNCPAENGK